MANHVPSPRMVSCHQCGGKGYTVPWRLNTLPRTCSLCKGTGWVPVLPADGCDAITRAREKGGG